ncbi:Protein FAM200B [Takifugu flavidus]|uniref:Protein FAM200B n=1 Tax=Takifugu flavidus TaxID=433684 RepID=A0A5C6MLS6_9TELE|nr:Protein FAM200B [Takifugu flavidus]
MMMMELPREKLVGWTTDGAPAMCGHRSGLVAKIREKMQEENVTAELTAHHCIIHLESLCAEALNMEHGMFTITHAVNFIRAKGLIQRQFKAFLSQWQTQRGDLPHHTEVRWLSQGKVLQRCFQLPEEIGCSWTAKGKTRLNSQTKDVDLTVIIIPAVNGRHVSFLLKSERRLHLHGKWYWTGDAGHKCRMGRRSMQVSQDTWEQWRPPEEEDSLSPRVQKHVFYA